MRLLPSVKASGKPQVRAPRRMAKPSAPPRRGGSPPQAGAGRPKASASPQSPAKSKPNSVPAVRLVDLFKSYFCTRRFQIIASATPPMITMPPRTQRISAKMSGNRNAADILPMPSMLPQEPTELHALFCMERILPKPKRASNPTSRTPSPCAATM